MQRPAGVTIIAILGFILGAVAIFEALMMIRTSKVAGSGMAVYESGRFTGLVLLAGAALVIFTCVGLLKLREWSRVLAIVLNAAHLVLAALGLMDAFRHIHTPFFLGVMFRHVVMLAIGTGIIVYLLRPGVKRAFRPEIPSAT